MPPNTKKDDAGDDQQDLSPEQTQVNELIRTLVKSNGVADSQVYQKIAQTLGIGYHTVRRRFRGQGEWPYWEVNRLFEAFGKTPQDLSPEHISENKDVGTATMTADLNRSSTIQADAALTQAIIGLLERKNIPPVKHVATLSRLIGTSHSLVRRRIESGGWGWGEVNLILEHFQVSPNELLSNTVVTRMEASMQDAILIVDGAPARAQCYVLLGSVTRGTGDDRKAIIAGRDEKHRLIVGSPKDVFRAAHEPYFLVERLEYLKPSGSSLRLAVLDDDEHAATSMTDAMRDFGYAASTFTSAQALVAAGLDSFDAFIIDLKLGPKQTCLELVRKIKAEVPNASIVVASGAGVTRDEPMLQADRSTLIREERVNVLVKPVPSQDLRDILLAEHKEKNQGA